MEIDSKVVELTELAYTIPSRRLAQLLAEWAAADRVLESRLLAYAAAADQGSDGSEPAGRDWRL
ncbi:hypothetical protein [Verrucosispora sp. WMMD573]|uniref:hypothetical protein n=1 Tax=Verrucosispora sp. WMMD573 TaxID=3015149 RepID=UPI00248AAC9B|nr:hypothetical protein [Verrucosispora sp. WMMD573]WBB54095.1 hypothetical protein O7601_26715 [Verrucosispora sp. WMMD573]